MFASKIDRRRGARLGPGRIRGVTRQAVVGIVAVCGLSWPCFSGEQRGPTLSSADFDRPPSATCGIQEAMDALPPEGGSVTIPPGKHCLRRSVALRSHVTLRGSGSATVLTRGKQVLAKLTKPARKGESSAEVDATTGFSVGDEVFLFDGVMRGDNAAHCVIKKVDPQRLEFTGPIFSRHPEGVFSLAPGTHHGALIVNYFPFIRGNLDPDPIRDIAILQIVFDGNLGENLGPWADYTLAAIYASNIFDALIRDCAVRGSIGDGICVGGGDYRVEDCLVEHCRGYGLHAGTLRGALFSNNIIRHNTDDGMYFCVAVTGISVRNNIFHDNKGNGIGGVKNGDQYNLIAGNVLMNNGLHAICLDGGDSNVVTGNTCLDNSRKDEGKYSGICVRNTKRTVITGNFCGNSAGGTRPQKFGIEETGTSDANTITANVCEGRDAGDLVIAGANTQASANIGKVAAPTVK